MNFIRSIFLSYAIFMLFVFQVRAEILSPETQETRSAPDRLSTEPEFSGTNLFALSFFTDRLNFEIAGSSVHTAEKGPVFFCVQLNTQDSKIAPILPLIQYIEIALDNQAENTQRLKAKAFLKAGKKSSFSDCYLGKVDIKANTALGEYRLTELDLVLNSNRIISLREFLSQTSAAGAIQVDSTIEDNTPPQIEKIESLHSLEKKMRFLGNIASGKISFRVRATDTGVGIDPKTLRVFFKLQFDHDPVDIVESECKQQKKNSVYRCKLRFSRAKPDLKRREAFLELSSIAIADRFGNSIEILDPEELKKLTGEAPLIIHFQ